MTFTFANHDHEPDTMSPCHECARLGVEQRQQRDAHTVSAQPKVVVDDNDLANVLSVSVSYELRRRSLLRIVAYAWGQGWDACIAEFAGRLEDITKSARDSLTDPLSTPPYGPSVTDGQLTLLAEEVPHG